MKTFKVFGELPLVLVATAVFGLSQTLNTQSQPGASHEMAQPGTINYVEGQVSVDNQSLNLRGPVITAQSGDVLATGNGFAEVLLTPGAFLRLGQNSEMRVTSAGLAATQIQLNRGAASIEVDQLIDGTHLALGMNGGATAQLEKKGLYDFNADQQTVKVLDGKATVMTAAGSKSIGRGDQLLLASDKPLKSHGFDMKAERTQPLYIWSEARSRDESQVNVAAAQNVATYGGFYGAGWYWNPYWSAYAFLPGSGFLYSPFGWGFYSPAFIGYYGMPFGYGRYGVLRGGYVGGANAHVGASFHSFGGGFHGGGGRR